MMLKFIKNMLFVIEVLDIIDLFKEEFLAPRHKSLRAVDLSAGSRIFDRDEIIQDFSGAANK